MIVGEPSLMSCDFSEKDERLIIQFENAKYDLITQVGDSTSKDVSPSSNPPDKKKSPKNC